MTVGREDTLRPSYSLYSLGAIDWATALGSILAGAFLLYRNYRSIDAADRARISVADRARTTVIFGLIGFGVILLCVWLEPESWHLPRGLYQLAQVAVVHWYVKSTHGEFLSAHETAGGRFYSNWRAAGIAMIIALLILILFVAGALIFSLSGAR